jgi:hypothetical protein
MTRWESILAMVVGLTWSLTGCRPETSNHPDVEYEAPADAKYCQFGDRFVALIAAGKFEDAYAMCSSHLTSKVSLEQFRADRQAEQAVYGVIQSVDPITYCETDENILRGPDDVRPSGDRVEDGFNRLEAARSVGEISADVPFEIRRAALQATLLIDPTSVPDLDYEAGDEEELEVTSYLHLVIVEENGQLAVAHLWRRWPDILD